MLRTINTNICFEDRNKKNIFDVIKRIKSDFHIMDLNKIISMPTSLTGFVVDTTSYLQYALELYRNGKGELLNTLNERDQCIDKFIDNIINRRKNNDCGKIMYDNYLTHGFPTWREFCAKKWGLGDNCVYGSSLFNVNTISLITLKQYPKPVIIQLSKMFPNDTIWVKYASDIPGEYVKSFKLKNGEVIISHKISDKRLIYCEVFKKSKSLFLDLERRETIKDIIT